MRNKELPEEVVAPTGVPSEPSRRKIVLVEAGDLGEQEARDVAERSLETGKGELTGIAGFGKRIWKYNLFREYYRQKELSSAREAIFDDENIFAASGQKAEGGYHDREMEALVERFSSEYDEVVHKEAGESREVLRSAPENEEVQKAIKKLIRDYAGGVIDDAAFAEERTRIISLLPSDGSTGERGSALYADNLKKIADEVKASVKNTADLESLDLDFEIVTGRAKGAVRTESQFNTVDRLVDRIEKTPIGRFVNEATIASAVSIAYSLTAGLSQRIASSRAVAWGTFGAGAFLGGGIAGLREKKRLEEERRQHARESAKGETFNGEDAPRRAEMEHFRYETRNATELADKLEETLFIKNEDGDLIPRELDQETWRAAVSQLTEIESRISLSDRRKIDLISYSDAKTVSQEQTRLDILRAKAKIALRSAATDAPRTVIEEKNIPGQELEYEVPGLVTTEEIRTFTEGEEYQGETDPKKRRDLLAYWLSEERMKKGFTIPDIESNHGSFTDAAAREYANWDWARVEEISEALREVRPAETIKEERTIRGFNIPPGKTADEFFVSLTEAKIVNLLEGRGGIEARDVLFKAMKRRKVAQAVGKGIITGLVIGGVAQEVGAFLRDNQEGLIEGLMRGEGTAEGNPAHFTSLEYLRRWWSGDFPRMPLGISSEVVIAGRHINLPEGVGLLPNSDGSYAFTRNGELIHNVRFDGNGILAAESRRALEEQGIQMQSWNQEISETVTTEAPMSVADSEEVQVGTKEYLLNHPENTNRITRDLWYDQNTPKPVFDKNELRLWWGGTKGSGIDSSGNYVFDVKHMMPDGSYHEGLKANAQELLKDGKLKMLFSLSRDTQNQAFEIPIQADGTVKIDPNSEMGKMFFANNGGKAEFLGRFAEVAEVTKTVDDVDHFRILATHEGRGVDSLTDTIVTGREELVSTATTVTHTEYFDSFDVPADYRVDPPPIIPIFGRTPLERPKEKPQEIPYYYLYGGEIDKDRESQYREKFSPRLREDPSAVLDSEEEIKGYFERQKKGYVTEVEAVVDQIEPMSKDCRVSVCIPVAGHQEGENIYSTLENYLDQELPKENYELLLLVNHPDQDREGKKVKPDKTMSEVKRFQEEHPEVNVRLMYNVFPISEARIGRVRKLLNDAALMRHQKRGKGFLDLVMVSNDADNKGMSPEYLKNFVDKFDKNENVDALMGQLDWDPESYIRNPLVHVGTRLFQYMSVQFRQKKAHIESSGANFAFRSSIYAAVDGYSADRGGGEDVDFGTKIKVARRGAVDRTPIAFAGARVSRIYTSSRRAEKAIKDGLSPVEQWDRGFGAFDDEVRKVKWENEGKPIDFTNPEEVDNFIKALEVVINRTMNSVMGWGGDASHPAFLKSLRWLGLKCDIVGSHTIKIKDASVLLRGLEEYQKEGLSILERKTKKSRPRKVKTKTRKTVSRKKPK